MNEVERYHDLMCALPNPVFVFGSNTGGLHGAGAARAALEHYGAIMGIGEGLVGQSYAIPTKNDRLETLPYYDIAKRVKRFLDFAALCPRHNFVLTRVGCGLAGLTDHDIAPVFGGAPANVYLPVEWAPLLKAVPLDIG